MYLFKVYYHYHFISKSVALSCYYTVITILPTDVKKMFDQIQQIE